ncbi:MAG TPA: ATP-binding protein [Aquabacterium sp.]|nr:ATP-binding protein [Aquabacterium sp.]
MGLDRHSTNWNGASELIANQVDWLACWRETAGNENAVGRFEFALRHRQAIVEPVELALLGQLAQQDGIRARIKAQPRWDTMGQFAGFHGVVEPVVEAPDSAPAFDPVAGSAAEDPVAPSDQAVSVVPTPMTEADQEVLRYALSHDLRAPLRVVDGFTRIVKEDYGKVLDRMGLDHLDRVLAAAARMNGMIDAILAQAQLAGAPLQREFIDLTALSKDIASEMGSLPGVGATAKFEIAEGMAVEADPILVRRVLENLLSNALKYSAKVEAPLIQVGVMPATNPAVFFVRDNGAGFDMQRADKLFGLFQRMHSAKDFPGTGVGLAGVHNIIRRHGGQVWAEASPGQGACFYFTLMGTAEAQQRAMKTGT